MNRMLLELVGGLIQVSKECDLNTRKLGRTKICLRSLYLPE